MTAVCNACGQEWARHPVLEVECPKCHAAVGIGCSRPSGHAGPLIEPHVEREQRAVDDGVLEPCPASAFGEGLTQKGEGPPSESPDRSQPVLFAA